MQRSCDGTFAKDGVQSIAEDGADVNPTFARAGKQAHTRAPMRLGASSPSYHRRPRIQGFAQIVRPDSQTVDAREPPGIASPEASARAGRLRAGGGDE